MSGNNITKSELISALAEKTGEPKTKCAENLNALLEIIQDNVAAGNEVAITGFGTFSPRHRAARVGRNPSSGEPVNINEAVTPAFKAGAVFKAKVAKKD